MDALSLSLHFSPLMDVRALYFVAGIATLLMGLKIFTTRKIPFWRIACFAAFLFILSGPSLHEEEREPTPSVAVAVVDESASQSFGERTTRSNAALTHIQRSLGENDQIDLRVVHGPLDGGLANLTALFESLETALADIPESRRAGVVFISDGQIHDVPDIEALQQKYGPVHLLLSGEKDETDRRIVIENAPAFGLVGQDIRVDFKVIDSGARRVQNTARVTLQLSDGTTRSDIAVINKTHSITLPVNHAGQNVFEISVEPLADELTLRNNSAAIDFQGVRDRLRVLLVSGKPHAGGRTWRDLLTADPSVDLVHFTILREPEKIDATPQNEMSLIAFPFRELFEEKLYDFDLIIFDRYRVNRILPDRYFQNIVRYVEEGGAFLEASGPSYAGEDSVYYTTLRDILPGVPDGNIISQDYTPRISDIGKSHPVTRDLSAADDLVWGAWKRQIGLSSTTGDVLMTGVGSNPLLVLNRLNEGRVAQIASDHIWLWSRAYDGGGPHAELLRRTVHWLMKEPELDEQALDVRVDGRTLIIRRAAFARAEDTLTMTLPDGKTEEIILTPNQDGILEYLDKAEQTGIYRFETTDGNLRFAVVGEIDPPEFRNVLSSDEPLKPIIDQSDGGVLWLAETPTPSIRVSKNGPYAGRDWIALKNAQGYSVIGARETPLLPLWLSIIFLVSLSVTAWFFEGRRGL